MYKISFRIASKKTHFQNIFGNHYFLVFSSCGGGTVPEYLSEAKVDVSIWTPKRSSLQKRGLNCESDSAIKDSTNFLIVSGASLQTYKQ
jgi:hypothetical protein